MIKNTILNYKKILILIFILTFSFLLCSCSLFGDKTGSEEKEYVYALTSTVEGGKNFYQYEEISNDWKVFITENNQKIEIANFETDKSEVNNTKVGEYKIKFYFTYNNEYYFAFTMINILENPIIGIDVLGTFIFKKGTFSSVDWQYYLLYSSGFKKEYETFFDTDVSNVNINEIGAYPIYFSYKCENGETFVLSKTVEIMDESDFNDHTSEDSPLKYKLEFVSGTINFVSQEDVSTEDWKFIISNNKNNDEISVSVNQNNTFKFSSFEEFVVGENDVKVKLEYDTGTEIVELSCIVKVEISKKIEYANVKFYIENEFLSETKAVIGEALDVEEYFPLYNENKDYLSELFYALYDENGELTSMFSIQNRKFVIPDDVVITGYYYPPEIVDIKFAGTKKFVINKNEFSSDDWRVLAVYNDGKTKQLSDGYTFDTSTVNESIPGTYTVNVEFLDADGTKFEDSVLIDIYRETTKDTYLSYFISENNSELIETIDEIGKTVIYDDEDELLSAKSTVENQYVRLNQSCSYEIEYNLSPQFYFLKTYNDFDGYRYWAIPLASITTDEYNALKITSAGNYTNGQAAQTKDTFIDYGVANALELNITEFSTRKIEYTKLLEKKKNIPYYIRKDDGKVGRYTCVITKNLGVFNFDETIDTPKETFFINSKNEELTLYYGNIKATILSKDMELQNRLNKNFFKELAYVNNFSYVYADDEIATEGLEIIDKIEVGTIISVNNINNLAFYKFQFISFSKILNVKKYKFEYLYLYDSEYQENGIFEDEEGNEIIIFFDKRETTLTQK